MKFWLDVNNPPIYNNYMWVGSIADFVKVVASCKEISERIECVDISYDFYCDFKMTETLKDCKIKWH